MAQNECIPFYENGQTITAQAEEAATGKTFAEIAGSRPYGPGFSLTSTDSGGGNIPVKTAAAGSKPFGVYANDQPTVGGKVSIICGVGFVVPITAGQAIPANAEVSVGAGGKVVPRSGQKATAAAGHGGTVASNNAVEVKARAADSSGNNIQVIVEPLGKSTAFGIVQQGNTFRVTLKTSAGSVAETTATTLITELEANAGFKAIAEAKNYLASTGAGVVEPMTIALAGGLDDISRAVGLCVSAANENEDAQIKLY